MLSLDTALFLLDCVFLRKRKLTAPTTATAITAVTKMYDNGNELFVVAVVVNPV